MKKIIVSILIFTLLISVALLTGCDSETNTQTTVPETTEKAPGKYSDSKFVGAWYNADADGALICTLNDDGTAIFKDDKNAMWTETESGITITSTVNGAAVTMDGYFVIAGDGYVARATDANMHYLDEGGTLQLEIMLTENTCVDCIQK